MCFNILGACKFFEQQVFVKQIAKQHADYLLGFILIAYKICIWTNRRQEIMPRRHYIDFHFKESIVNDDSLKEAKCTPFGSDDYSLIKCKIIVDDVSKHQFNGSILQSKNL